MPQDYHRKQMFRVWAEPKTIEDFTYLPGATHVERFERVVALGLKNAESQGEPTQVTAGPPVLLTGYIMTLADFSPDEIIAHVLTWKRVPTGKLVALLTERIAAQGWSF